MSASSLESKTIRPGSLGSYSYYHSNRTQPARHTAFIASGRHKLLSAKLIIPVLIIAAIIGLPILRGGDTAKKPVASQSKTQKTVPPATAAAVVAAPAKAADNCDGNTSSKLVLVSISQRHMWACQEGKTVYDSPVITGMIAQESTITPTGTFHIYGKHADTTLTGSDETGSWSDPVSYWMPFLSNQYGVYGFHDATWRSNDAFGNTSPDSSDASHGCVELPLSSSAWLYNWAKVGTAVTIKS